MSATFLMDNLVDGIVVEWMSMQVMLFENNENPSIQRTISETVTIFPTRCLSMVVGGDAEV